MLTQCATCHAYYDPSFVTVHDPPDCFEHTHVIHPSDEVLAAYVDDTTLASSKQDDHDTFEDAIFNGYVVTSKRALSSVERQRIDEHLNYCPRCYELVSETRAVLQRDKQIAQDEVREEYRESYRQIADRTYDHDD